MDAEVMELCRKIRRTDLQIETLKEEQKQVKAEREEAINRLMAIADDEIAGQGRHFVVIELNPEYISIAMRRLEREVPLLIGVGI